IRRNRLNRVGGARYDAAVKAERPLFETADPEAEAEGDSRADADVRNDRLIGHEAVRRWLASWGSTKAIPRPRIGD
ncbi:MAG: hypothetical protein ABIR60_13430, partial [Allosphingosinicella sp.]